MKWVFVIIAGIFASFFLDYAAPDADGWDRLWMTMAFFGTIYSLLMAHWIEDHMGGGK